MLNLAESSQIYVDSFSLLNKLSAAYELGGSTKTALIFAARMRDIEGDTEYENIIGDVTFGRLLVKTGNSLAGTQLLEPALLMNIDEEIKVEIYVVLSRAYAELGQYDRASQFAQKVLSNDVTLDVHQRAAVLGVLSDVAKSKGGFDVALNFKEEQIKLETQRLKAALETDRREASLTASMSQQVNEEKAKAKHSVLKFQKRMNVVAMMIGLILLISSIIVLVAYYRTKRQNVELELARERASVGEKAKTEFLAMINHEVRTPLNTIIPLSDHLARAVIIPEQKKILMHIASAGRDLFDQIENIFMMSGTVSAETEDLQDTDIHSLLLDVAKRAKEQINTNRKMRFQASPNLKAPVRIHSKTVRHVLSNILSNAVKFSDTDGTITVKAVYNGQNTLVFTVEDDGLGIDPEDVEGLMRPFEQVDSSIKRLHGGAGLGLSVANKLTKAMGGTLSLDTQIGMGTKVTISLPCETSVQFTAIDMAA